MGSLLHYVQQARENYEDQETKEELLKIYETA